MNLDAIWFHVKNLGGEMKERLFEERKRHMRETNSLQIAITVSGKFGVRTPRSTFPISSDTMNNIAFSAFQQIQRILGNYFPYTASTFKVTKMSLSASWRTNTTHLVEDTNVKESAEEFDAECPLTSCTLKEAVTNEEAQVAESQEPRLLEPSKQQAEPRVLQNNLELKQQEVRPGPILRVTDEFLEEYKESGILSNNELPQPPQMPLPASNTSAFIKRLRRFRQRTVKIET